MCCSSGKECGEPRARTLLPDGQEPIHMWCRTAWFQRSQPGCNIQRGCGRSNGLPATGTGPTCSRQPHLRCGRPPRECHHGAGSAAAGQANHGMVQVVGQTSTTKTAELAARHMDQGVENHAAGYAHHRQCESTLIHQTPANGRAQRRLTARSSPHSLCSS